GRVRLGKFDARSFPGAKYVAPVTHHGQTGGVTFLVGTDLAGHVKPFGLFNPDSSRAAPPALIAGPSLPVSRKIGPLDINPIYRDGRLYVTWSECVPDGDGCAPYHRVRAVRIPVQSAGGRPIAASTDVARGFLDVTIGEREPDDAPGDLVDYEK